MPELQTRVEYGHILPQWGWINEFRGIKYASYQRTVHFYIDEPVAIDHWTYTDHRHPVEGCTHDRHDLTGLQVVRLAGSPWKPGDPCFTCGSTNTTFDSDGMAHCLSCNRNDGDE